MIIEQKEALRTVPVAAIGKSPSHAVKTGNATISVQTID
jgi:hypothetical protein